MTGVAAGIRPAAVAEMDGLVAVVAVRMPPLNGHLELVAQSPTAPYAVVDSDVIISGLLHLLKSLLSLRKNTFTCYTF